MALDHIIHIWLVIIWLVIIIIKQLINITIINVTNGINRSFFKKVWSYFPHIMLPILDLNIKCCIGDYFFLSSTFYYTTESTPCVKVMQHGYSVLHCYSRLSLILVASYFLNVGIIGMGWKLKLFTASYPNTV